MSQHPYARLTPRDRELLRRRVAGGMGVSDAAQQAGVSHQTSSSGPKQRLGTQHLTTNASFDSARKPSERRADPEAGRVAKHPDLAL